MEPLTEEHKAQIEESLEVLRKSEEILQRAKQAGLEVDDQITENADLHKRLTGLKRAFFPIGG